MGWETPESWKEEGEVLSSKKGVGNKKISFTGKTLKKEEGRG